MDEQSCPVYEELLADTRTLVSHIAAWSAKWSAPEKSIENSSKSQRDELTQLLDEFATAMEAMTDVN